MFPVLLISNNTYLTLPYFIFNLHQMNWKPSGKRGMRHDDEDYLIMRPSADCIRWAQVGGNTTIRVIRSTLLFTV